MRPHIRRLLESAGFSPRQLFAALQGAWLEPTQGYIWQENTGVTPTTTGGQTIGLLLDQSQRAVLGPELISNPGPFTATTGWSTTSATPLSVSGGALTASSAGSTDGLVYGAWNEPVQIRYLELRVTITALTGRVRFKIYGSNITGDWMTSPGTYSWRVYQTVGNNNVGLNTDQATTVSVSSFSLKQILGNHAYQSTANQRPLLGRRYNLLTYSEDFTAETYYGNFASNAIWTQNAAVSPVGTNNAMKIVAKNGVSGYVGGGLNVHSIPVTVGNEYVFSIYVAPAELTSVSLREGASTGNIVTVNLTTGTSSGNFGGPVVVSGLINGYRRISVYRTVTASTWSNSVVGTGTGDGVSGVYIWGADFRLSSDVGKDPSYQRITTATDYDYGQYPAAYHDTNDSLVVSLPSINVRRNLLTYSENFTNAAWSTGNATVTPNAVLAPNNLSAAAKITTIATAPTNFSRAVVNVSSAVLTYSIYAKKGSGATDLNRFGIYNASTGQNIVFAYVDYDTGAVTYSTGSSGITTENAGGGWWRIKVSPTSGISAENNIVIYFGAIGEPGAGGRYVYVWGAQLELGSVATDYQKITDWTSEAYASSGSVYFATPVGMSALHNQSMGTTYTLPALSSDIYSWIVVPQRLSAVHENRLAQYMQRKAGIAGPDYFEQVDYGPELVVNGDFSNGTTGWAAVNGAVLTVDSGVLVITNGSASYGEAHQLVPTTIGITYTLSITYIQGTDNPAIYIGSSGASSYDYGYATALSSGVYTLIFKAISTQARIRLSHTNNSIGLTVKYDNISVRELKDGMTGQLFDDSGELLLAQ